MSEPNGGIKKCKWMRCIWGDICSPAGDMGCDRCEHFTALDGDKPLGTMLWEHRGEFREEWLEMMEGREVHG